MATAKPRARAQVAEQDTGNQVEDLEITVNVPKQFTVTFDDSSTKTFSVGPATMLQSEFDHWYVQAHGVTLFEKPAK